MTTDRHKAGELDEVVNISTETQRNGSVYAATCLVRLVQRMSYRNGLYGQNLQQLHTQAPYWPAVYDDQNNISVIYNCSKAV